MNRQLFLYTIPLIILALLSFNARKLSASFSDGTDGGNRTKVIQDEAPVTIYTDGEDLQQVIDNAPNHSTVICNRNRQLVLSKPIVISKPLTLKGINAALPEHLGKTPLIEVKSEGVTITDFVLRGNAATVSQDDRAALLAIFFGDFRIERGLVENSSKEGIEVDQQEFPNLIDGGVIRDIIGRGCVRDVISLGGPAGPEPHIRNILIENIRGYNSSMRGPVEISDGCINVTVRKIYSEDCLYAVDIQDHNKQEINRNIFIYDVYALRCIHAIRTANHPNGHSNLNLMNITAEQCEKTLYVSNTENVTIQNVKIIGYKGEGPAMSVINCDALTVRDVSLVDCTSREAGLLVENCSDVIIDAVMLKNTENLSSAVTYRISENKTFSNLSITHVHAKKTGDAGIVLEKRGRDASLSDYIILGNIAQVADRTSGTNGLVINNIE